VVKNNKDTYEKLSAMICYARVGTTVSSLIMYFYRTDENKLDIGCLQFNRPTKNVSFINNPYKCSNGGEK
jgi:hypothetical protein